MFIYNEAAELQSKLEQIKMIANEILPFVTPEQQEEIRKIIKLSTLTEKSTGPNTIGTRRGIIRE